MMRRDNLLGRNGVFLVVIVSVGSTDWTERPAGHQRYWQQASREDCVHETSTVISNIKHVHLSLTEDILGHHLARLQRTECTCPATSEEEHLLPL